MESLVGKYRQDIKFELDYGIPVPPDFAGYILQDMFVRIRGWYDPVNYSRPDENELYGMLIDIEDGEKRMSSDAKLTYKQILASQEAKDIKEKERFEKYYKAKGTPLKRESAGSFRTGMYLLMIPTKKHLGDPGVKPGDVMKEQIELIKQYIKDMRKQWETLWRHVNNLGDKYRSEFDSFHKKLEADEPHGRWELFRSFVTNTINGEKTDIFKYQTMLEWLLGKPDIAGDEKTLLKTVKKLCVPLMEDATYQIQIDWAVPYIVYYPFFDHGLLKAGKGYPDSPDYYFPFHDFIGDFPNLNLVKISASHSSYSPVTLKPTGFSLLAIAAQIIANISFLTEQNLLAVEEYRNYSFKLELVKQALYGGIPMEKGPFKEYSMASMNEKIKETDARYPRKKWEEEMKSGIFKGYVKDTPTVTGNQDQLLMGIQDVQWLQDFFQSVASAECTERDGLNERRIAALQGLYSSLDNLHKLPEWHTALADLWMWNTDKYGSILYVHMTELLLAQSPLGNGIYDRLHKRIIFESKAFDKSLEEWKKTELAADGTAHITDNWYLIFPEYVTTILENQYERFANEVIAKAGKNFEKAAEKLRIPLKKILRHFIPSLELNLKQWDVKIDDLSKKILALDGLNELRKGTITEKKKKALDLAVKKMVTQTTIQAEADLEKMKTTVRSQKICKGAGVLLDMLAFVCFGVYKGMAGEEGAVSKWKFEEFTGLGVQMVVLADDAISFSRFTGLTKVVQGTKLASGLKLLGKVAGWLGVAQSAIEALCNVFAEDWKNALLDGSAMIGGIMFLVGMGMIEGGAGASVTVVGIPLGIVLAVVGGLLAVAAAIIQFFSLWENKTEKYCRHLLLEDSEKGGCKKFETYKKDFEFGSTRIYRGLKYDKKAFGDDLQKVDALVDRVINFLYDYDTYDAYSR